MDSEPQQHRAGVLQVGALLHRAGCRGGSATTSGPCRSGHRCGEPSLLNITPVGYQPVGMNPSTSLRAGVLDIDDRHGVVVGVGDQQGLAVGRQAAGRSASSPAARSGTARRAICSRAVRAATSTTHTALVLAHATNRRCPSFENTIALGCSPTTTSPVFSSVAALKASTLAPPHTDTYTVLPSGRDDAGVGFGADVHGAHHQARLEVEHRERFAEHVDGIEITSGRFDADAADETLLDGFGTVDAGHRALRIASEAVGPARLQPAVGEVELADRRLSCAGREDPPPVGVPRQAQPRVFQLACGWRSCPSAGPPRSGSVSRSRCW